MVVLVVQRCAPIRLFLPQQNPWLARRFNLETVQLCMSDNVFGYICKADVMIIIANPGQSRERRKPMKNPASDATLL